MSSAQVCRARDSAISRLRQVCASGLTVSVSHPVSAFLVLASSNVDRRTALSLAIGGAGGRLGFLSVTRCFTTGGKCLTTMAVRLSLRAAGGPARCMSDNRSPWANAKCGGITQEIGICEIHGSMASEGPVSWKTNRFCTRVTQSHTDKLQENRFESYSIEPVPHTITS